MKPRLSKTQLILAFLLAPAFVLLPQSAVGQVGKSSGQAPALQNASLDASSIQENLQKIASLLTPTMDVVDPVPDVDHRENISIPRRVPLLTSSTSHNWLLLIGIDKYEHVSQLQNCVGDLKTVRDILQQHYRFDREHTIELYDRQATRDNIIRKLEELVSSVGRKDNVIIYYEGHGTYNPTLHRAYWLPVDAGTESAARYFASSELQAFVEAINSRSTLVISDACYSGNMFPGSDAPVPFKPSLTEIQRSVSLTARQVVTSGGNEPVAGNWLFLDEHSLFAHYLINQLENNTDKYLPVSTLFAQVGPRVSSKGFQTPQFRTIQNAGDEGGEFVFARN